MTRIKGQLTKSDYLPKSEFDRLVDRLHQDQLYFWELYCRLSFCTGLRASDILPLSWSEVLNNNVLMVKERKTGKRRRICFHVTVVNKITELYDLLGRPETGEFIFGNPRTSHPYSLEYVNLKLKEFRDNYNLPIKAFSTHTFRKTFGRFIWESEGRTMEALLKLSDALNHDSPKTTMIYLGIRQDEIDELYEAIQF